MSLWGALGLLPQDEVRSHTNFLCVDSCLIRPLRLTHHSSICRTKTNLMLQGGLLGALLYNIAGTQALRRPRASQRVHCHPR
jgi:hypothetical protein